MYILCWPARVELMCIHMYTQQRGPKPRGTGLIILRSCLASPDTSRCRCRSHRCADFHGTGSQPVPRQTTRPSKIAWLRLVSSRVAFVRGLLDGPGRFSRGSHFVHMISSTSIFPSPSSCIAPHRNPPEFISVRRLVTSRSSALIPLTRSSACSSPIGGQQQTAQRPTQKRGENDKNNKKRRACARRHVTRSRRKREQEGLN